MCMYVYGILQNWSLYPKKNWCIVMGLGHNDPWVESHMWPQQTWGQRSSRGQWPLVQVFGNKRVSVSTYFDVFSNLILQWLQKHVIAKAGETRGSRTALSFLLSIWGRCPLPSLWCHTYHQLFMFSNFLCPKWYKTIILSSIYFSAPEIIVNVHTGQVQDQDLVIIWFYIWHISR